MGIGSLFGLGSDAGDVSSADIQDTRRDFNALLKPFLGSAGKIYNTEARWKPKYTELGLRNLNTTLTGGNGTPGLIDLFSAAQTGGRSANFEDYQTFDPEGAALMNQLTETASQGLSAGNRLTSSDVYNITSGVRGDWADRGFAPNGNAQLDEAVQLATAGEGLRQSRQNYAQGVAGLGQNQYGVLSQTNLPELAFGFNQGTGPTLHNSDQAGNILNSVYGAKNAANQATAANNTSLWQSFDANSTGLASSL